MDKIILFHGSPDKIINPVFGGGEDKHDYGKGFYLTESSELASEWAVCRPNDLNGWVHKYELETEGLKILDFQGESVLTWLAELMKHRDAADSKRYRMLAQKFIARYGIETEEYDVIKGWRANASYFYIAKAFLIKLCLANIMQQPADGKAFFRVGSLYKVLFHHDLVNLYAVLNQAA